MQKSKFYQTAYGCSHIPQIISKICVMYYNFLYIPELVVSQNLDTNLWPKKSDM